MGGAAAHMPETPADFAALDDAEYLPTSFSLERALSRCSDRAVSAGRYHDVRGGRKGRRLLDDFETDPGAVVLGRGSTVEVVSVLGRHDRRRYALKSFFKPSTSDEELGLLTNELELYLGLYHPHIVKLEGIYETDEDIHLVMECCEGGELYDRLRQCGSFSEQQAASAVRQIIRAVGYLHSRGIAHRDCKLENLLYESMSPSSPLKLADFGLAQAFRPSSLMRRCCGSPEYVAPEILSLDGYTCQCDLWSVGVVTFMLLTGQAPFPPSQDQLERVKEGAVDWGCSDIWPRLSSDSLDFLQRLLVIDPDLRMDAQQAVFHPWLLRMLGNHVHVPTLDSRVLHSFQSYAAASRVRRIALQMAAQHLPLEELAPLRHVFLGLDLGNEGVIHVRDLRRTLCGQNAPAGLDELLSAMDALGDGAGISYSEFLAAATQVVSGSAAQLAFRRLDIRGAGAIDAGDLQVAFGLPGLGGDRGEAASAEDGGLSELLDGEGSPKETAPEGTLGFDKFVRFLNEGRGAGPSREGAPPPASSGLVATAEGLLSAARTAFWGTGGVAAVAA